MSISRIRDYWRVIARVRAGGKVVERWGRAETKEAAKTLWAELKDKIRECAPVINRSLKLSLKKIKHLLAVHRKCFEKKKGRPFSPGYNTGIVSMERMFGECDIIQFPDRFDRFIGKLQAEKKYHMANRYIEIARAAYNSCKKYIPNNPITVERFPETDELARDRDLQPEEISLLILTAARNRRTCHLARLLQYNFLVPVRKAELVKMQIGNIDLFGKRIRIHNGTTKNERGVWKPIPPVMLRWFTLRFKQAKSKNEPIFYRKVKGTIKPLGDFKTAWKTVRNNCNITDLRFHDGRHVSASNLIRYGTPRTIVNEMANWKTDMLRIYYHSASDVDYRFAKWPTKPEREGGVQVVSAVNR
jgi:integrase